MNDRIIRVYREYQCTSNPKMYFWFTKQFNLMTFKTTNIQKYNYAFEAFGMPMYTKHTPLFRRVIGNWAILYLPSSYKNNFIFYYPGIGLQKKYELFKGYWELDHKFVT